MTPAQIATLMAEVSRDRDHGTQDHWWCERIGDHLRDMGEYDAQDQIDKARILRLPALERALIALTQSKETP